MKRVLFVLLVFSVLLTAQTHPDSYIDNALHKGIDLIISQHYTEAKNVFKELYDKYPDNPLGNIYLAAVEISKAEDYGLPPNQNYIKYRLETAEKISLKLLNNSPNNVWYKYYYALSVGYKAYFHGINNEYYAGFSDGLTSVNTFEECLKLNSSFYDAHIAIGAYKYWKSRKTEWVPFVSNEKKDGVESLIKAIKQNTYNYHLAVYSLMWIYIDMKEWNKSVVLASGRLKKYPESRYYKWGLARAYEESNPLKSAETFGEILNSYNYNSTENNHLNEIILKHKMAMQYNKAGKKEKALSLCKEITSITNLNDFVKSKLGNRLNRVKNLQTELEK